MTTTTLTLADFLLARLHAEEAAWSAGGALMTQPQFAGLSRSMLRDVAAKRKIVELHAPVEVTTGYDSRTVTRTTSAYCGICHTDSVYDPVETWPCDTVRALASVYADHPDWREEWR